VFNFKSLLPEGLVRLLEYRRRFAALRFPGHFYWFRKYRNALEVSKIEMVPAQYRQRLQCIVDVGANLGEWSIAMALFTPARKIIAYEPVPEVFNHLKEFAKPHSQIQCIQSAVGSYIGRTRINLEDIHQLSSLLAITDEGRTFHSIEHTQSKQIEVPITTLDHDLRDYDEISLLKIDVQGYEPEVLKGARDVLQRTLILMVEIFYTPYYNGAASFEELLQLITSVSPMKLWGITGPAVAKDGKPIWADAIFVRQGP
jgi:FkbM family methyltransferase